MKIIVKTFEDGNSCLNFQSSVPSAEFPVPDEELLLRHAEFIVKQVYTLDDGVDADECFITTSAMRTLIELSGVTFGKR